MAQRFRVCTIWAMIQQASDVIILAPPGSGENRWRKASLHAFIAIAVLALSACSSKKEQNAAPAVTAESTEAALSAAEDYLAAQKYNNALVILEKLVERKPDCVEAWESLGQVRYSQAIEAQLAGKPEDAMKARSDAYAHYAKAVSLQPDSAGLQHAAGLMALGAGQQADALEHFAKAGTLDPTNVQHPLYEAQVLLHQGRIDDAEVALERAHAIDKDEPFTLSSMAVVALEREDFDRAIELIDEAREIDPRSIDFRVQAARIYRRAGKPRTSIELLQPLPDAQRINESVTIELATAYEAVGEFDRAGRTWSARFQESYKDWKAALHAADAFLRAGNRTGAAVMFDAAQIIAPNEAEVQAFGERFAATDG